MAGWRKMLNLPERKAKPQATDAEDSDTRPPAPLTAGTWDEEHESGAKSAARRAGRLVLWALIALLALSGLRSWIAPTPAHESGAPAPAPSTTAGQVPTAQAQQIAAQFARSYLSWDSSAPQVRANELAQLIPVGADPKMGWSGTGNEQVAQTIPGEVVQLGGDRARVSVIVRVAVFTTVHGSQIVTNSWRGLQVPVALVSGQVTITGQPALVGLPGPVTYNPPTPPDPDSALTSATSSTVQQFLTAWSAGNPSQASAPGATILPLAGPISLSSLDAWNVDVGGGPKRYGTATVTWNIAGAQLQQTYRITLLQVVAAGASAWQVSAVTAAD